MTRLRVIAASLLLILMMPLARACAELPGVAAAQHECCKRTADRCCEGSSKACCGTHIPADTALFPSQGVVRLLVPPQTVAGVHLDRMGSLTVQRAAMRRPKEHSPPGLVIVATTVLRI